VIFFQKKRKKLTMSTMDANEFIKGGYILQPRVIDESDIIHEPPVVRELWLYLLRKVNHRNIGKFKRGSGFFSLEEISNDLHWFVGFRKMKYSKPQLTKSLRRLRERNMIATMKATRGVFVTICKYDYYQDPKNYEGNDEEIMKETRKQRGGITKNKNEKNERIKEEKTLSWRDDFEIYKSELIKAFDLIKKDIKFIEKQERYNPGVDVILSIEKSIDVYWIKEGGWKNKKKSQTVNIDWPATFANSISQPINKVFISRNNEAKNQVVHQIPPIIPAI
jgi:hypothetical protein